MKERDNMIEAELKKETSFSTKYCFKIFTISITIFMFSFLFYLLKNDAIHSEGLIIEKIKELGIFAPFIFILLQIFQVVFPVIPGGASCLIGVLLFGPVTGFIYNYIGLILGSCLAYFLSQKYGLTIIHKFFKEETTQKYLKYIQNHTFFKIFMLGIILPGFPDDLLCYIAGISNIKFKPFLLIVLLGKPISLLAYSLFPKLF